MADNPPADTPRVVARLAYDDAAAALEFLNHAFDFPERPGARVASSDGTIVITEVDVLDSYIMVGKAGGHGLASPASAGAATQALIVYVDQIDAHFERARDAGAEIVSEPADQFWGDRRYEARDPEGHLWSFHEHTRDVPQYQIDAAIRSIAGGAE